MTLHYYFTTHYPPLSAPLCLGETISSYLLRSILSNGTALLLYDPLSTALRSTLSSEKAADYHPLLLTLSDENTADSLLHFSLSSKTILHPIICCAPICRRDDSRLSITLTLSSETTANSLLHSSGMTV
jgi:hypothetical protein